MRLNREQRMLLIGFIVVVIILVGAIIGINLSRRNTPQPEGVSAIVMPTLLPTEEVVNPFEGMTEEEIAAMAMQEEEDGDFISGFDDPVELPDITADPNATPMPID